MRACGVARLMQSLTACGCIPRAALVRDNLYTGTAGWTFPRSVAAAFAGSGSHLVRYATAFCAAEINSCFHPSHMPSTYARWAASVPSHFRFAVKLSKEITHTRKLVDARVPLAQFLTEIANLGDRLGLILVQLPPSLSFDKQVATRFFTRLRKAHSGLVVCEPRHVSWLAPEADGLLARIGVARVAADPARAPEAAEPGGWRGLVYHRLHGSPRMYWSSYGPEVLSALASKLRASIASGTPTWCIFDNTTSGTAAENALDLSLRMRSVARVRDMHP